MASFPGPLFHEIKSKPDQQQKSISGNKPLINPCHGISVPKNPNWRTVEHNSVKKEGALEINHPTGISKPHPTFPSAEAAPAAQYEDAQSQITPPRNYWDLFAWGRNNGDCANCSRQQPPAPRANPKLDSAVEEQPRFEFMSKLLIISRLGAHVSLSHHYKTSGLV